MKFIIRDDDLNYFSTPSDIERVYNPVFSQGIPVGVAAIPFVGDGADVFPWNFPQTRSDYPLGDNQVLVQYLAAHDQIEVLQHGCTHLTVSGVFEYQKTAGLYADTTRGKHHLEEILGKKISVFVAPHDQFSNHAIRAIESEGMHIIRSKGSRNFLPRRSYVSLLARMVIHRVRFFFLPNTQKPAYPFVADLGAHKEAYSYRIENGYDHLLFGLQYAQKHNTHFILVNHVHMMTDELMDTMLRLIDTAKQMGVEFARPSELFHE